jgi:hypothetical protein
MTTTPLSLAMMVREAVVGDLGEDVAPWLASQLPFLVAVDGDEVLGWAASARSAYRSATASSTAGGGTASSSNG